MALNRRNAKDLADVARAGGSLDFAASRYSVSDLTEIARAASGAGVKVIFRDVSRHNINDLVAIARAGTSCVTFAD